MKKSLMGLKKSPRAEGEPKLLKGLHKSPEGLKKSPKGLKKGQQKHGDSTVKSNLKCGVHVS
jgi:hypothetical protein